MKTYLTNGGLSLLNHLVTTEETLRFTRAEIGTGIVSGEEACRARTSLVQKAADALLSDLRRNGNAVHIEMQYANTGVSAGFYIREVGLYAQDPSGGADVLYAYGVFDENPDWIAPESTGQYVRVYELHSEITNLSSVVIEASASAMVSKSEMLEVASTKIPKLPGATEGNIPTFDASGSIADSGVSMAGFTRAIFTVQDGTTLVITTEGYTGSNDGGGEE